LAVLRQAFIAVSGFHQSILQLSGERLRACYDLAPPETKAYFEAEIVFWTTNLSS
jgi:hypothetical protein